MSMEHDPIKSTLLHEVGMLPPELMPDDFDGIHFFIDVTNQHRSGEIDKDGVNALIASKLAQRAFDSTVRASVDSIKISNDQYERYVNRFPMEDPRD